MTKYNTRYSLGLIALFACIIFYSCFTRKEAAVSKYYPGRYTLDLPKSWANRTKIIKAITDIVPVVATELKGKEFCMNCSAGFTVKLVIEDALIETYYSENNGPLRNQGAGQQVTGFRFSSYFVVYNSKNEGIVKIIITDPGKDFFLWRTNYGGANGGGPEGATPPAKMLGKYDTYYIDPRDYTQVNATASGGGVRPQFAKPIKEIQLDYAEQKLYAMRDIIRNIESAK